LCKNRKMNTYLMSNSSLSACGILSLRVKPKIQLFRSAWQATPNFRGTHLNDYRLEGVLDGHDEDLVPHGIQFPVNGARLVEEATADLELDIRITQSCGRAKDKRNFSLQCQCIVSSAWLSTKEWVDGWTGNSYKMCFI